jgi:hypothetical protein
MPGLSAAGVNQRLVKHMDRGYSRTVKGQSCANRVTGTPTAMKIQVNCHDNHRVALSIDQYLMRRVTCASLSPTGKAASMNRGRLNTARIPFDSAYPSFG